MNVDQGFKLHPGAAQDIMEIWEYIAEDSLLAARRIREEILDAIHRLVPFPYQGHFACNRGVYNGVVKLDRSTQASFGRFRIRLMNLLAIVVSE